MTSTTQLNTTRVTIGYAVFNTVEGANQLENSIPSRIKDQLKKDKWELNRYPMNSRQYKWKLHNCKQIFAQMHTSQATVLELGLNQYSQIINEINMVRYPNLTELRLYKNRIESIQGLCRIKMPNLKLLSIGDNVITNIGSLSKIKCPMLNWLRMDQNLINNLEPLALTDMPLLNLLCIDYQGDQAQSHQQTWMFKMQPVIFKRLTYKSKKRIDSYAINQMKEGKFPKQQPYRHLFERRVPIQQMRQQIRELPLQRLIERPLVQHIEQPQNQPEQEVEVENENENENEQVDFQEEALLINQEQPPRK